MRHSQQLAGERRKRLVFRLFLHHGAATAFVEAPSAAKTAFRFPISKISLSICPITLTAGPNSAKASSSSSISFGWLIGLRYSSRMWSKNTVIFFSALASSSALIYAPQFLVIPASEKDLVVSAW